MVTAVMCGVRCVVFGKWRSVQCVAWCVCSVSHVCVCMYVCGSVRGCG